MKRKRNDFTIKPNTQSERVQTDLWNVVVANKERITTVQGKEKAQRIADALNLDPYFLDRGQTFSDRAKGSPGG